MVREFSEEKRQEIFRLLDEIDNREWKSFMEWCGSSAEEFGDWPERLNVSAYTRYVDEYHKKVLELNEMTRQQVNTVFENVAEINARYAERMRDCQEKIREQIATVRTMTEFMESMTDGNPNMALITKGNVNESCVRTEVESHANGEESVSNQGQDGCRNYNIYEWYINKLYENNRISDEECRYLRYLLTTAPHVPESERVIIMGIFEERLSYFVNTRNDYSIGYLWIQNNLTMLDFYLEQNSLEWPDLIKQIVLSEYYDTYVSENITTPLMTAGAESFMEGSGLDWEKCQQLYDSISIISTWYGKPMQLNGNSPQEQELFKRLCGDDNHFRIPWTQEKVDQLWESCEQMYDEYGIAIDPRFLLAIIIQEGTGSFNTSSENLAADGGHGIEGNYTRDLMRANALLFGKTLGYIYYNEQFREAVNNNSDKLEDISGSIFTYYNWQTPIIDLDKDCVWTGVYAGDYSWGTNAEIIYEQLTYKGAGKEYNQYILNLDPSVVQDIAEEITIPNFTFTATDNGLDSKGEECGAYTVIAK